MSKIIIWDLDNTLYIETPEFKDSLNRATALAAINDFNVPLDVETATIEVKDSYAKSRDGIDTFSKRYNIPHKDLYLAYHKYKKDLIPTITPNEGLLELLTSLDCPQYVFSASTHSICEDILKHIGLYEFFKDRFYSIEDFGIYKKNENPDIYQKFCQHLNLDAKDCIFVDDSFSNLKFGKQAGFTTVKIFYKDNSKGDKDFIDYSYKGIYNCIEGLKQDLGC